MTELFERNSTLVTVVPETVGVALSVLEEPEVIDEGDAESDTEAVGVVVAWMLTVTVMAAEVAGVGLQVADVPLTFAV